MKLVSLFITSIIFLAVSASLVLAHPSVNHNGAGGVWHEFQFTAGAITIVVAPVAVFFLVRAFLERN